MLSFILLSEIYQIVNLFTHLCYRMKKRLWQMVKKFPMRVVLGSSWVNISRGKIIFRQFCLH